VTDVTKTIAGLSQQREKDEGIDKSKWAFYNLDRPSTFVPSDTEIGWPVFLSA
jgi:hypothetical protein